MKKIPNANWSSPSPLNYKPHSLTMLWLCFGLLIFGIGEALLITAGLGVSPWTVLAQGVSELFGWRIGVSNFVVSVLVLCLWIPLRQMPGIGTILNIVIISAALDYSLPYLPSPSTLPWQLLQTLVGIFTVGLGSGIYLTANLGPGPRDGLMTGLQRVSDFPIAWVRTLIEVTVVVLGWVLGGTFGVGTLMYAFGIGSAVSIGLYVVDKCNWQTVDSAHG